MVWKSETLNAMKMFAYALTGRVDGGSLEGAAFTFEDEVIPVGERRRVHTFGARAVGEDQVLTGPTAPRWEQPSRRDASVVEDDVGLPSTT